IFRFSCVLALRACRSLPTRRSSDLIPDGAPWGQSMSHSGFAIRAVRVFDPNTVTDRFVVDSWMGSDVVTDVGEIDSDGRFEPAEDPNDSGAESHLLRAVKITLDEGGDA